MKYIGLYILFFTLIFYTSCKGQSTTYGPSTMVRNIEKDIKGNIWLAAWKDIIRYDGKSFTNITSKASSGNYWSALEDRKGNFWFSTIGSGVYYYDGKSFQNFTTKEGLLNNEIGCIYEDKAGNIWFGANGGASRYDGKSFQNYMMTGDSMVEVEAGKTFPDFTRPPSEVNSIVEDKTGKLWFGTRGQAFVYDGKKFNVFTSNGKGFSNVRTIIEDRKGNIWLGGSAGLWRFDGNACTNVTTDFIGYIYEDKKGNIWTSSMKYQAWVLSRYDAKSLYDKNPTVVDLKSQPVMLCGILEDDNGGIWVGAGDGVSRFDGGIFTDFKK